MIDPRSLVRESVALAMCVATAVLVTWPLTANLATHAAGDLGDPLEYVWLVGWGAHAITEHPLAIFDSNMYFPLDNTLVFSENLLGLALPLAPLTRLGGNALLATNVGILASIALASYGVRRLVLVLGGAQVPALLAGLAFAVAPYRVTSISHVHVLAMHLFPFALIAFVRLVRSPSIARAAVLAAVVAAQIWTSMTVGTMTVLAVATAGVWWLAVRRREAVVPVAVAAAACAVALVLAAPVLVAYRAALDEHPAYSHPDVETIANSATPSAYLYAADGGSLARHAYDELEVRFEPSVSSHEKMLFPGLTLTTAAAASVVVGVTALARWRRTRTTGDATTGGDREAPVVLAVLLGALGFVLSLGPRWGAREGGLPLPYALLDAVGGGLGRVPARFGVMVTFAIAVGAGVVLGRSRGRAHVVIASIVVAVLFAEAWPPAIVPTRAPSINAVHRSLDGTDRTLLVLPTTEWTEEGTLRSILPVIRETQAQWLSTAHFRPMVNGYGAFLPELYVDVTRAVQVFPSDRGLAALERIGVDTVVVETSLTPGTPWADVGQRLADWPGVRLVADAEGTQVWDVSGAQRSG